VGPGDYVPENKYDTMKKKSPRYSFAAATTPIKALISPFKQKGYIVPGPGS